MYRRTEVGFNSRVASHSCTSAGVIDAGSRFSNVSIAFRWLPMFFAVSPATSMRLARYASAH
jgi:hypothetical protein